MTDKTDSQHMNDAVEHLMKARDSVNEINPFSSWNGKEMFTRQLSELILTMNGFANLQRLLEADVARRKAEESRD